MTMERKAFFVDELKRQYQQTISLAHRAEQEAAEGADHIRAESTRKEDTKSAVELGRIASGHRTRRQAAARELESLVAFASRGLPRLRPDAPIALGAMIDVSIEGEDGREERTVFLLPVGAGTELTGPGGDGFVSVITAGSPLGRELVGSRAGDSFEIVVNGRDREWRVVDVA